MPTKRKKTKKGLQTTVYFDRELGESLLKKCAESSMSIQAFIRFAIKRATQNELDDKVEALQSFQYDVVSFLSQKISHIEALAIASRHVDAELYERELERVRMQNAKHVLRLIQRAYETDSSSDQEASVTDDI